MAKKVIASSKKKVRIDPPPRVSKRALYTGVSRAFRPGNELVRVVMNGGAPAAAVVRRLLTAGQYYVSVGRREEKHAKKNLISAAGKFHLPTYLPTY